MTIPGWRPLAAETQRLYSPIGLRLVDEVTGAAPVGWTRAVLDVQEGPAWRTTEIPAARTADDVLFYPALGRRRAATGQPPRHYRVRVEAEFYRPLYLATQDGIEFDAYPYDDSNPPTSYARLPQDVKLAPAPAYPFPAYVPVLRGVVVAPPANAPVRDVEVMLVNTERVLTDEGGAFALPARFTAPGVPVPLDAMDQRTGRTGSKTVTLPAALGQLHTITIL